MKKKFLTSFLLIFLLSTGALANKTSAKINAEKNIGTYVGLGNPFPSLLGLNAAYNINENLRAVLGYGEVEVTTSASFDGTTFATSSTKATTYAAGADYLFTDWAIRPIVGARVGYFNIKGDGEFSVQGFDESTFLAYASAGLDYLARGGFYFGAGMNASFVGKSSSSFYANLGYFF